VRDVAQKIGFTITVSRHQSYFTLQCNQVSNDDDDHRTKNLSRQLIHPTPTPCLNMCMNAHSGGPPRTSESGNQGCGSHIAELVRTAVPFFFYDCENR
jgi:hypothetical protein